MRRQGHHPVGVRNVASFPGWSEGLSSHQPRHHIWNSATVIEDKRSILSNVAFGVRVPDWNFLRLSCFRLSLVSRATMELFLLVTTASDGCGEG